VYGGEGKITIVKNAYFSGDTNPEANITEERDSRRLAAKASTWFIGDYLFPGEL
jgi:hypothetical protein